MKLGKIKKQLQGYEAFIPKRNLIEEIMAFPPELIAKAAQAERLIGKLDGIAHIHPDANFFISMYVKKDATYSAQIEGSKATIMDVIEMEVGLNLDDTDAQDILHYIKALNYGIERLDKFPFSLRFIREIHKELMTDARSSHFSDPGEFRKSQNWIGGTNPGNAMYVPPPPDEMVNAMGDLETFIYKDSLMPVLQAGIIHAHFETIHPFLDGNGRTGRLLITLFLYQRAVLETPVLFISSYFKKHQKTYYEKLDDYHNDRVNSWINFFLDAVIQTAIESIDTSKKIMLLREKHMRALQSLGKREADSGVHFLQLLYKNPLVSGALVTQQMNFSRTGALKLIERFVNLGILTVKDESVKYGRTYIYKEYIEIFNS
ncbi:MAG: Fic family protein [Ferruginibacter sp.]